jgi:hypothetical protein
MIPGKQKKYDFRYEIQQSNNNNLREEKLN